MIRRCDEGDVPSIYEIVNDAAGAYKGVIPADRWHEPYMPMDELLGQIAEGVVFHGYEEEGSLLGVMGIQDKGDVFLIRHAYVRSSARRKGIGAALLRRLVADTQRPVLIGTWTDASWALDFYRKNGFRELSRKETESLLKRYWSIPARQVETSTVLADSRWSSPLPEKGLSGRPSPPTAPSGLELEL